MGCKLRVLGGPYGVVTDISESGARFNFHHAVALNEDFDVPIKILNRIIWARVHPVWAQPLPAPQVFGMGGSFTVLNDEDRETIRNFVQTRLRRPFRFISRLLWNAEAKI